MHGKIKSMIFYKLKGSINNKTFFPESYPESFSYKYTTLFCLGRHLQQGSIILLLPPLRGRGGKKSKIRNQGREFKTYKEKEG